MKITMTALVLAAMAAAAMAQDSSENRMNYQVPRTKSEEPSVLPSTFGNRMNIQYVAGTSAELTGDRNPNENRMNYQLPKAAPKAQPKKQIEQVPIDLRVEP
jgi:hypothetical protein